MAADNQEAERKRKKSGASKTQAAAAKASERDIADIAGYETDATSSGKTRMKLKKKSKSRKANGDTGYETDDGYISSTAGHPALHKSKSKSRFFKLGNRSKTQIDDDESREVPPPVPIPPPLPVFRLPIAERFATTLGDVNRGATAEPPLGPSPSLPFASSTNSLLSTPSSSSITTPKEFDLTDGPSLLPDLGPKRNFVHFASTQQKDVTHNRDSGSSDSHSPSGNNSLFSKLNFSSFEPFSSSNNTSPVKSKAPSPTSRPLSPPTTSKPKPPVISYPITRSPSPPPSPPTIQIIPNPSPNKESTKNVPRPLFLHRVPSDQGKALNPQKNRSPLPDDWSPAGSPFVVLTPNPTPSPTLEPRHPGTQKLNSSDTVTKQPSRLLIPSSGTPGRDYSPSRSPVIPSADYIVPSPRPGTDDLHFTPPVIHHSPYSELPAATPPPASPLPDVPLANGPSNQDSGSYFASQQRRHPEPSHSNSNLAVNATLQRGRESPFPSPSNSTTNLTINSTPQRGRESPFPSRPVLPTSHRSSHRPQPGSDLAGFESRVKVKRYRDLYGWKGQIEDDRGTGPQDTSGREPDFRRHRPRRSTKVGIKIEEPSDDEGYGGEDGFGDSDYYDEEEVNYVVNGMFGDRSVSDLGHYGGDDQRETEAALSRSHSYEALRDRYQNPQTTIAMVRPRRGGRSQSRPSSPNVQSKPSFESSVDEADLSDDKSRYPDDEVNAGRTTMYSTLGGDLSRRGSWESGSRVSFMDNERSQQARERFLRRVDMFYDETGRERPSPAPRGVGRGAIPAVPPVPRLPKAVKQPPVGSSKVWI